MSVSPDPAELSAPRDPAAYGRSRLLGAGFWALIAFGVICVLAGVGVAHFGPQLFPVRPAPAAEADVAPYDVAPQRPVAAAPVAPLLAEPAPAAPSAEITQLSERLTTLEGMESRTAQAAASALAAAALVEAAQTSRPFADELTALAAVAPPSAELSSLHRLAEIGAPSRAALASGFPEAAASAAAAARAPSTGAGLVARVAHAFSRIVTLRQVGDVPGKGVDATIARAERQVEDGDIDTALRTLDGLPPPAREAMSAWRARAERRAEIDRRVSGLRAQALADLAKLARSGG
jgi:hypothetical protein